MTDATDDVNEKKDVQIRLPIESFRAAFVEMVFRGSGENPPETVMASGTGFYYRADGNDYFVTARHNVTGRHWQTNQLLSKNFSVGPTHLHVRIREQPPPEGYNSATPVQVGHVKYRLYEEGSGRPMWLEHPQYGRRLDVVALPVGLPGGVFIVPWEAEETTKDSDDELLDTYWIAQDVSIVGFPFGLMGGFDLPLWIRGTVASEPEIPYAIDDENLPLFLVDARTRSGQSGAPVLIMKQPYTPIPQPDGTFGYSKWPRSRLIGAYTGRISSESDLGFVWRIEAIDYLCRHGVRPPT